MHIAEDFINNEEINEPFQQATEDVTTDSDDEDEVQADNMLETYLQMGETIADHNGEEDISCNLILDIFEEEDLQDDENYNEDDSN